MIPLFPITHQTSGQPITIQKLIPDGRGTQLHHFKHVPADRLRAVAERARADHRLEETTRSLIEALHLQQVCQQPQSKPYRQPQHRPDHGQAQSDSEVSSEVSMQRHTTNDSIQHIPTASTLLSEQGTQTAIACGGGSRGGATSSLPSLHLLRTLQQRLVDALQQVSQLRSKGPWQERVVDQLDWNRKLVRMDEFHTNITRQMYVLSRQVDMIMDRVCSVPQSRITAVVKADVIRQLVRAHRSALRIIQAFGQNYWDGSLDGRQAARFLEALSVCRNLVQICAHISVQLPEMVDLPERLAAMVEQHVTRSGDVSSLIREMALGRFGTSADSQGRISACAEAQRRGRCWPVVTGRSVPAAPSRQSSKQRQHMASAMDRCVFARVERASVKSAPVARRRLLGASRAARPGSAPHALLNRPGSAPRARPGNAEHPVPGTEVLLPTLPEEGTSGDRSQHGSAQSPQPAATRDRQRSVDTARLVSAVEDAVGRALARSTTQTAGFPDRGPLRGRYRGGRQAGTERDEPPTPRDQPRYADDKCRGAGAAPAPSSRTRRQLHQLVRRLDQMQQERDTIRRRWQPLIDARKHQTEEMWSDAQWPQVAPLGARADLVNGYHTASGEHSVTTTDACTSTTGLITRHTMLEHAVRPRNVPNSTLPGSNPSASRAGPTVDEGRGRLGSGPVPNIRDMFAEEAISPTLRRGIAAELRSAVANTDDDDVKALSESTLHQLVNDYISEAGVDIFLHQLFQQEFELG